MKGDSLLLIGRRLLQAAPVVMGIIVVTFILTRALPGDPAVFFAGPATDEKSIAEIRASLGLDKSWPEQFWVYLQNLSRGDLGKSISTGQPVLEELATRLPASLELTLMGCFSPSPSPSLWECWRPRGPTRSSITSAVSL